MNPQSRQAVLGVLCVVLGVVLVLSLDPALMGAGAALAVLGLLLLVVGAGRWIYGSLRG